MLLGYLVQKDPTSKKRATERNSFFKRHGFKLYATQAYWLFITVPCSNFLTLGMVDTQNYFRHWSEAKTKCTLKKAVHELALLHCPYMGHEHHVVLHFNFYVLGETRPFFSHTQLLVIW